MIAPPHAPTTAADAAAATTATATATVDVAAADRAERAWRAGDTVAAIEAADRALAEGTDPDGRAAGVAAAVAAADGALRDAAARWRQVAATSDGATAVEAGGRAALVAALLGHVDAARVDLATARRGMAEPAPRGLSVLLDGVDAVLDAVRGDLAGAGRCLAGLAAATVPSDVFAVDPWDELTVAVTMAAGDHAGARAMLDGPYTPRRALLAAWLDLRAGRLDDARRGLEAAAARPVLRRNAVLAAAVSVGLARRTGDAAVLAATWHRVAPVVAGADVELLALDAWGELSVAAVSAETQDSLALAMADAVDAAGRPAWCATVEGWWRVQRAVAAGRAVASEPWMDGDGALAVAARVWVAVLAGDVDPDAVRRAAARLVAAGRSWDAAELCRVAATRAVEPSAARALLEAARGLRGRGSVAGSAGLSGREREVGLLVLDGLTQREIGARLYISPKTVEQHVAGMRRKLGAANRAELVAGLRERLATVPAPTRPAGRPAGTRSPR